MTEENRESAQPESSFASWLKLTTDFWNNFPALKSFSDSENPEQKNDVASFLAAWTKFTSGFWNSDWIKNMSSNSEKTTPDNGPQNKNAVNNRFLDQWQTSLNFMKSFSKTLSEPESANAAIKSLNTLPDVVLKMLKSGCEAGIQVQQKLLEKAEKIGKTTEAYNFENLDQEVFKAFSDIYEKELSQYLHIPQVGLTRFYQERVADLMDKHNILETTLAEFLSILYLPMEKANKVTQEKLESMAEQGILPKESKENYALWVKVLEGHYMTLFKSKDYTDALHNTLNRLEDFVMAKNETLRDVLQFFPIPTNKEMDELYKEFHLLKRRVKELEKKLNIPLNKV